MADGKLRNEKPSRGPGEAVGMPTAHQMRPLMADTEVRIALLPPFEREIGQCWLQRLSAVPEAGELAAIADDDSEPTRSPLWVYENGVPLGPAHAPHATIRDLGAGAFSHWKDTLYLSSSDGTDPNSNGRSYELRLEQHDCPSEDRDSPQPAQSLRYRYFLLRHARLLGEKAAAADALDTALERETLEVERQIIEASGRFDDAFYRRCYGAVMADGILPVDHFLTVGHDRGFLASARFDPVVYKLLHPFRQHANTLIDSILQADDAPYRDLAALFRDVGADTMPMTIRYHPGLRAEWSAKARLMIGNRDLPDRISGPGFRHDLLNPSPDVILSRIAEDRPFCFARLPHGFWDDFSACRRLATRLRNDARCRFLNGDEVFNLSTRLLGCSRTFSSNQVYESFFSEIEADLLDNPRDEAFWTAISLKGIPTFDGGLYGFDEEDVKDRAELLACFFRSADKLYDAMLWKRWALTGDMAKFPEAVRDHPVIVVGPPQFRSLGAKWRLSTFCHVEIPPDFSHLLRQRILTSVAQAIESLLGARGDKKPIVLFQCSGELSYWFMRRLRPRYGDAFYIDIGQALDLWHWQPDAVWARIYGDAIREANPSLVAAPDDGTLPAASNSIPVSSYEEALGIVRTDYLNTSLIISASEPMHVIAGEFTPQGTNGWEAALPPDLECLTDNDEAPRHSPLLLLEDGKVLGYGHNRHADIFSEGRGLYSFWKGFLYFSTSDNSDPNLNGRRYAIGGKIDYVTDKRSDFGA